MNMEQLKQAVNGNVGDLIEDIKIVVSDALRR